MSDVTSARADFFAAFPAQYREHIVQFAKRISVLDVDVLMFTARKAVCLFHCLESLGVFDAGKKLVVSERWMDHDQQWLQGKKVAIIDEVIVTGTSIYALHEQLVDAGVARVEVHCLFVNSTHFVEDFFVSINLVPGYIRLKGEEAHALSTAIVEAMYEVPRPYSVDYPMSTWVDIRLNSVDRLISLPGWETLERHWMDCKPSASGRRTTYFRITPRAEIAELIDEAIGGNVFERSLAKVRLYGVAEGEGAQARYKFRIVPYLVMGRITLSEVSRIFASMLGVLQLGEQEAVLGSCVTDDSKLRLIQYVFASRLAQFWSLSLARQGIQAPFRQDSGELNYIFPVAIHGAILKMAACAPDEKLIFEWPQVEEIELPTRAANSSLPTYYKLVEPFNRLYLDKELPVRRLALELGRKIFNSRKYSKMVQRLKDGYSLEDLKLKAMKAGAPADNATLSDFLDLGIDSGVIVPITAKKTIGGKQYVYRAYRHGEETYILYRDLSFFQLMLQGFAKEWNRTQQLDSSMTVPRLVTEKLLVLFMRYAVSNDLLRTC